MNPNWDLKLINSKPTFGLGDPNIDILARLFQELQVTLACHAAFVTKAANETEFLDDFTMDVDDVEPRVAKDHLMQKLADAIEKTREEMTQNGKEGSWKQAKCNSTPATSHFDALVDNGKPLVLDSGDLAVLLRRIKVVEALKAVACSDLATEQGLQWLFKGKGSKKSYDELLELLHSHNVDDFHHFTVLNYKQTVHTWKQTIEKIILSIQHAVIGISAEEPQKEKSELSRSFCNFVLDYIDLVSRKLDRIHKDCAHEETKSDAKQDIEDDRLVVFDDSQGQDVGEAQAKVCNHYLMRFLDNKPKNCSEDVDMESDSQAYYEQSHSGDEPRNDEGESESEDEDGEDDMDDDLSPSDDEEKSNRSPPPSNLNVTSRGPNSSCTAKKAPKAPPPRENEAPSAHQARDCREPHEMHIRDILSRLDRVEGKVDLLESFQDRDKSVGH